MRLPPCAADRQNPRSFLPPSARKRHRVARGIPKTERPHFCPTSEPAECSFGLARFDTLRQKCCRRHAGSMTFSRVNRAVTVLGGRRGGELLGDGALELERPVGQHRRPWRPAGRDRPALTVDAAQRMHADAQRIGLPSASLASDRVCRWGDRPAWSCCWRGSHCCRPTGLFGQFAAARHGILYSAVSEERSLKGAVRPVKRPGSEIHKSRMEIA